MSTKPPRMRPAGRRHYAPHDAPYDPRVGKPYDRVCEDLDDMTHHMEFEGVGERPTPDVIFGGKNDDKR